MHNVSEEIKSALSEIQKGVEPPFVDGGWSSEKDVIPRCSGCGVILIGDMTSTVIEEELSHYESMDGDIVITSPEEAYDLDELLDSSENGAYADRINAIINRVVVKTSHVTEDE